MLDPKQIDYKSLGFRAGLEIHHQLRTKRKLFCHCETNLDHVLMKTPEFTFERRFRAVMGEMGDFDPGMLVEVEKGYLVIYHANDQHVCTYEMDETPPFWCDQESLDIGLYLSDLFGCTSPVDEIQVNRKQYLDGSITTGFQRTMIVARDGHVQLLNGKKVRISNITIEEDAARKIKAIDRNRTVYYNLDRLGIPLTEIITNHEDIDTPEDLYETAKMIGLYLRTSGLVKRGIGVVRQDVNLSITGGNRAELKGVQELEMFPILCAHEVCRQHALIALKNELQIISVKKDDFTHTYVEVSHLFPDLQSGENVYAVKLPQFEKYLLYEVQPNKDFGMEIFEKVSLITGIQINELFHSGEIYSHALRRKDEQTKEQLFVNANQDKEIRRILQLKSSDGYIVARGPTHRVLHAMKKAIERVKQAFDGVPAETRRTLPNGNSEFLRVIHGRERLYPDTDTPVMVIDKDRRKNIHAQLKPNPHELFQLYKPNGLTFNQLEQIIRDEQIVLLQRLVIDLQIPLKIVLHVIHELFAYVHRLGLNPKNIHDVSIEKVLLAYKEGKIPRAALPNIIELLSKTANIEIQNRIIVEAVQTQISDEIVKKTIMVRLAEFPEKPPKNLFIGQIMAEFDRRIDGKKLSDIVEELL